MNKNVRSNKGFYSIRKVIHGCLYNQALADVRSTGAGIKSLYCTCISTHHHYFSRVHLDVLVSFRNENDIYETKYVITIMTSAE